MRALVCVLLGLAAMTVSALLLVAIVIFIPTITAPPPVWLLVSVSLVAVITAAYFMGSEILKEFGR